MTEQQLSWDRTHTELQIKCPIAPGITSVPSTGGKNDVCPFDQYSALYCGHLLGTRQDGKEVDDMGTGPPR